MKRMGMSQDLKEACHFHLLHVLFIVFARTEGTFGITTVSLGTEIGCSQHHGHSNRCVPCENCFFVRGDCGL